MEEKRQLIHEILAAIASTGRKADGDTFFALAFRTVEELRQLAAEIKRGIT